MKQETEYEISACLAGKEMCIRDELSAEAEVQVGKEEGTGAKIRGGL